MQLLDCKYMCNYLIAQIFFKILLKIRSGAEKNEKGQRIKSFSLFDKW
jgi:hypothetical protein